MMHLIYLILEIIYNTKSTDLFHFTALLKVNASIINMLAACHTSYSSLCHCRLRLCCTYVILLRCWLLFLRILGLAKINIRIIPISQLHIAKEIFCIIPQLLGAHRRVISSIKRIHFYPHEVYCIQYNVCNSCSINLLRMKLSDVVENILN